jgi:hypothetical protein
MELKQYRGYYGKNKSMYRTFNAPDDEAARGHAKVLGFFFVTRMEKGQEIEIYRKDDKR